VPLDRMLLLFRDDRRVQGRTHDQRDLLDVESVAGHLLKLVDEGKDTPRWQIAQRAAPDRVISVTDPEARHAHKTVLRRQDGFKAHLAVEPDTWLITDCALAKASGTGSSDAAIWAHAAGG
jgi:hypothetical protein